MTALNSPHPEPHLTIPLRLDASHRSTSPCYAWGGKPPAPCLPQSKTGGGGSPRLRGETEGVRRQPHQRCHPRARPEDLAFHQPARSSRRRKILGSSPRMTVAGPRTPPNSDSSASRLPQQSQRPNAKRMRDLSPSIPSPQSREILPDHLRKAGSRDVQRRGGDVIERCSPSECAVSSGQRGERVRIAVGNGCDCGHRGPGQNSPALPSPAASRQEVKDLCGTAGG